MLKKFLFGTLFLFMLSLASAEIHLVEPVDKLVSSNDSIEVGKISQGETIELIFSVDSGKDLQWNKAVVEEGFLPAEWKQSPSVLYGKTLGLKISLGKNAVEGTRNLKIKLFNEGSPGTEEFVNAVFFVKNNLVFPKIENLQQTTAVEQPVDFNVTIYNDSIASHFVEVGSTLPSYWMERKEVWIEGKKIKTFTVRVEPKTYGAISSVRNFDFVVKSKLNDSVLFTQQASLTVNPTLKSKYSASLYGFQFFSLSLMPFHLINSFISLLFT